MKDKISQRVINIVFIITLIIIYVFPISKDLNINSAHGDLFFYSRLIFIPITVIIFFLLFKKKTKNVIGYILLILCMLGYYYNYHAFSYTSLLLLTYFILFDDLHNNLDNYIPDKMLRIMIRICTISFIIQIAFFKIYNQQIVGLTSSFKDENYTGFFLIFLYFINKESGLNIKICYLLLLAAFLTFSRVTILAILVIILMRFFKNPFVKKITMKKPFIIFISALIIWIIISYCFVNYFENNSYEYEYLTGIKRMTKFVDYSNYIRTAINVNLIENINIKNLIIGYNDEDYNNIIYFKGKSAHPHNMFLSIYAECGIMFAIEYVRRFTMIFKDKEEMFEIFVVLLIYAMTLGPSAYYGIDLLLISLISTFERTEKNEEQE